jgi:hypothetical protein
MTGISRTVCGSLATLTGMGRTVKGDGLFESDVGASGTDPASEEQPFWKVRAEAKRPAKNSSRTRVTPLNNAVIFRYYRRELRQS